MNFTVTKTNYTASEQLFLFVWLIYSINCAVGSCYYNIRYFDTITGMQKIVVYLLILIQLVLVFRQFFANKISRTKFYLNFSVLAIIGVVEALNLNSGLVSLTFFLFLGQDVDIDKIISFDIKLKILILSIILSLCAFGVLENRQGDFQSGYKMAYGFGHPNLFAYFVITIMVEWLYLRFKKMKFYDWLGIVAITTTLIFISNARTSIYTFTLIFIMFLFANYASSFYRWKIIQFFIVISAPVIAFISFYLVKLYEQGNQLIIALNIVLSGRISYSYEAISNEGIRLLGNKVEFTNRVTRDTGLAYLIDNSYVRMALSWGSLLTFALIVLYMIFFIKCFQKNRLDLMLVVLFSVIAGFGESYAITAFYNITFLCMLGVAIKEKTPKFSPVKVS